MTDTGEWTDDMDRAPDPDLEEQPEDPEPAADPDPEPAADLEEQPEDPEPEDDDDGADDRSRANGEAAKYRRQRNEQRQRADDYGTRLFHALVAQDGRLTDPTDMPVDMDLLDDPEALDEAIGALVEKKPHLKRRRFDAIGSHERDERPAVSLAGILRQHS